MKPYLIGLTGNIASGKSVVRQYLENAGALTLDADLIAQDTYLPGQPAWQPILDRFGEDLCSQDGRINRSRLGRLVFSDPQALADLEAIVHPIVWQRLDALLERAKTPLVVLEAIRLINSNFEADCDEIWVTTCPEEVRVQRLVETRGLSEQDALVRVRSQEPEAEKIRHATRLVTTDGTFARVYQQVSDHLADIAQKHGISFAQNSGWQTVVPIQFDLILEHLSSAYANIETHDDIFRLLSQSDIISDGNLLVLYDNLHFLTLLHRVLPQKATLEEKQAVVSELERVADLHLSEALVAKQMWLAPREAKILGFEPGEYTASTPMGFIYNDVLRRRGLMPGEVYRKAI